MLRRAWIDSCWALVSIAASGCATGSSQSPGSTNLSNGASAAGAAGTAVAAGVIWAAGGGCRLQGCPYGSYCDNDNGFCQARKCSEGCPPTTVCNEGLDRCQAAAPARLPNDFQPTDNKLATPPTVH